MCPPLDQSPEDRVAPGVIIEMEGLRIEFGCESLDPLLVDPHSPRAKGLAQREVFEISFGHCCLPEFVAVLLRPVLAIALIEGLPILWRLTKLRLTQVCGLKSPRASSRGDWRLARHCAERSPQAQSAR